MPEARAAKFAKAKEEREAKARVKAREVLNTYRLVPDIYVLGSLEKSLTVFSQQVRAHNLAWSLHSEYGSKPINIAIVGSGIAGLTAVAALLLLFDEITITLLEKRKTLCPVLQGSDTRWLHPHIYNWPNAGSRAPSTRLPVMNWQEGRASDVVDRLLREFDAVLGERLNHTRKLVTYVDVKDVRIDPQTSTIAWTGLLVGGVDSSSGKSSFDSILVATGFGLELGPNTLSYWRNESLGQPELDVGVDKKYVVSGFGDGALIDLFRLTIQRFRQDRIIEDLFENSLEKLEEVLQGKVTSPAYSAIESIPNDIVGPAVQKLQKRLRPDAKAILHVGGKDGETRTFKSIFDHKAAVVNKLLLYLLHRANGFVTEDGPLEAVVARNGIPEERVISRHGVKPILEIEKMFAGQPAIEERLKALEKLQPQVADVLWPAWYYPYREGAY
jgi:hypothetical protein